MSLLQFAHRCFRRMLQGWLIYQGGTGTQSWYFVGFLIKPNFISWSVIGKISSSKSCHSLSSLQHQHYMFVYRFFLSQSYNQNVFLRKGFSKYNCCIKSCFKLEAFKIVHGLSWMVLSEGTEHTKHLVSN